MLIDILTIIVVCISFALFLIMHMIACRRMSAEALLKSLWTSCIVTMIFPITLTAFMAIVKVADLSLFIWLCIALFATVLHGMTCFVYVLCIFGPYETSVRMRLVREIFKVPKGITLKDLDRVYNNEVIAHIRLRRLTGSRYVIHQDQMYRIGNDTNVFFLFDIIAGFLTKMIGRK